MEHGYTRALALTAVRFTQNIQRHISCPEREVIGSTVGEVLDEYFSLHEAARSYVLDDQQRLRPHMAIFINGRQINDRDRLSDPIPANAIVDVIQALSGGSGLDE